MELSRGMAVRSLVPSLLCAMVFTASLAARVDCAESGSQAWSAKWIWRDRADIHAYNQTVIARRQFQLQRPESGRLRITADSFYRLYVNGTWVNDGPSRCWPEHFQYDEIDVFGNRFQRLLELGLEPFRSPQASFGVPAQRSRVLLFGRVGNS